MREIEAADADLLSPLVEVEQGEAMTILRGGQIVAELRPAKDAGRERAEAAIERLRQWRKTLPKSGVTAEDVLSWRHEGHRS